MRSIPASIGFAKVLPIDRPTNHRSEPVSRPKADQVIEQSDRWPYMTVEIAVRVKLNASLSRLDGLSQKGDLLNEVAGMYLLNFIEFQA